MKNIDERIAHIVRADGTKFQVRKRKLLRVDRSHPNVTTYNESVTADDDWDEGETARQYKKASRSEEI